MSDMHDANSAKAYRQAYEDGLNDWSRQQREYVEEDPFEDPELSDAARAALIGYGFKTRAELGKITEEEIRHFGRTGQIPEQELRAAQERAKATK